MEGARDEQGEDRIPGVECESRAPRRPAALRGWRGIRGEGRDQGGAAPRTAKQPFNARSRQLPETTEAAMRQQGRVLVWVAWSVVLWVVRVFVLRADVRGAFGL